MAKRKISMPYWCVENPVGDPFGPPVMDRISSIEATDILCNAKKEGLIDYTSAHDDDLVPWNPATPEDDLDTSSETYRTLSIIKEKLEKAGLEFVMSTCSLHGDPVFRNGGITNPDPRIRLLAAKKVMRALRIGNFLGARYFTYWVARDGFECQFAVPWGKNYEYLIDGLNLVTRYTEEEGLSIKNGTIETKPNEPRGEMYLPTVGHALALISNLEKPDFWGVNPEVLQHEQMTGLTGIGAVAFAASLGKLFFIHLGNQKPNQFDNDNPVTIGMDGLKEIVSILYILEKLGWKGHIEFDNHILRTDTAPGVKNKIELRKEFIKLNVEAYKLAEQKAEELAGDKELDKLRAEIWGSDEDITEILKGGDPEKISKAHVSYTEVNEKPIRIAQLDLYVNKKLFGM